METNVRTSTCRFCGRVLPVDSFPIKPGFVRARYKECAECHALGHSCIPKEEPKRKRRKFATEEERKAAQLEYQRRYREKHRDKKRESSRAAYWHRKGQEPPEEPQKSGRKKALTDEEKRQRKLECSRRWNKEHADQVREYQRNYYQRHKERIISQQMKYNNEHHGPEQKAKAMQEASDTGRFYCSQCKQILPAEEFITGGKQFKMCNDCRAQARIRKERMEREKAKPKQKKPKDKLCWKCWKWPCFQGIENMDSDFAKEGCVSFHLKEDAS